MMTQEITATMPKLLLDNQRAKLMEVYQKPGEIVNTHTHLGDYIVYSLTDSRARMFKDDGKVEEIDMKAGTAFFRRAETHTVENIGNTDSHILVFEFNEWGL